MSINKSKDNDSALGGMVQVYTGNGKGKTTAALGLALRALGQGLSVYMVQFLKGREYGEIKMAESLGPRFHIVQSGRDEFVYKGEATEEDLRLARDGLELARKVINSGEYDVVILDEANVAVDLEVLSAEDFLELIRERPEGVEIVLTGRNAPGEFIEIADLVSEVDEVKHYYREGVEMRRGFEY